jgi:transposase-like protein
VFTTRLARLVLALRDEAPRVAGWLAEQVPDTAAVYTLSTREPRRRLATTNSIGHNDMAERRRTCVVRVFLNEASFLRLGTVLAVERNEQRLGRRYLPVFAATVTEKAHLPAA